MLRITREANGEVVFRLSGRLTAENVAEVDRLISAEMKGKPIVVDCLDLNSADYEAIKRLEKWESGSIKLRDCGLYLRASIRRTRRERKSRKHFEK